MADPGFPVGDIDPLGGVNLQHERFMVKMYVKTKELGPVGGGVSWAHPLDPPMFTLYIWLARTIFPNVEHHISVVQWFKILE